MKEELIQFETAKLAKEKGFREKCYATYYDYINMYSHYTKKKRIERGLDKVKLSFNRETITIHPSEKLHGFSGCDTPDYFIRYSKYENCLFDNNINNFEAAKYWYSAPTQSFLQRWLRDTHNLHISIWYNNLTEKWRIDYIIDISSDTEYYCGKDREQSTYEQALEVGLYEGLKLIK